MDNQSTNRYHLNPYNIRWGSEIGHHPNLVRSRYFKKDKDDLSAAYMHASAKVRYYQWAFNTYLSFSSRRYNKNFLEYWTMKKNDYATEMKWRSMNRNRKSVSNIRLGYLKNWLYRFNSRDAKYKRLLNDFDRQMYARYLVLYNSGSIRWDPILNYNLKL